jgi:hypothetical protein
LARRVEISVSRWVCVVCVWTGLLFCLALCTFSSLNEMTHSSCEFEKKMNSNSQLLRKIQRLWSCTRSQEQNIRYSYVCEDWYPYIRTLQFYEQRYWCCRQWWIIPAQRHLLLLQAPHTNILAHPWSITRIITLWYKMKWLHVLLTCNFLYKIRTFHPFINIWYFRIFSCPGIYDVMCFQGYCLLAIAL